MFIHIFVVSLRGGSGGGGRGGGRGGGGVHTHFCFVYLAYACGGIGRSCVLFTLIDYYFTLVEFCFFPNFGRQYFAGVNWQVAKRTKVLSASM